MKFAVASSCLAWIATEPTSKRNRLSPYNSRA